MRTTYIKIGTKVSALSSELRCRIRPVCRLHPLHEKRSMGRLERTEDNFAAIQNAYQLISRGFIMINFD